MKKIERPEAERAANDLEWNFAVMTLLKELGRWPTQTEVDERLAQIGVDRVETRP